MQHSYLIVDDNTDNIREVREMFSNFPEYYCAGVATNKAEAVDKILELQPSIVIIEIGSKTKKSDLSLSVITDLHQFLNVLPYIIVHTATPKFAFDAIKAGVSDYLLKPLSLSELRKSLHRFLKTNPEAANNTICIKSYGDYQFVAMTDIVYLKADNNTTDFFLQSGRKLTAYKTLKHYEVTLPSYFTRIHNSYIVNANFISRINTGKSLVYLNDSELSISFSKTFKENIDSLIKKIAPENL